MSVWERGMLKHWKDNQLKAFKSKGTENRVGRNEALLWLMHFFFERQKLMGAWVDSGIRSTAHQGYSFGYHTAWAFPEDLGAMGTTFGGK